MHLAPPIALLLSLAAVAPTYRLRVLPAPEGCDSWSYLAHGLADSGAAIGNVQCGGSSGYRAVLWDAEGFHVLGSLGGRSSYAFGISRDGMTILGAADNGTMTADGRTVTRPVLWKDGAIVELETLGGPFGMATDIDQRGIVVGACERAEIDPRVNRAPVRACCWTGGVPSDLGGLGGPDAEAIDVNKRGWIVGWATNTTLAPSADGDTHIAFLHDGSGMKSLGTLGGAWSEAFGVNEAGEVVGYSETDDPDGDGYRETHAFAWSRGVMRDLGKNARGYSGALDVNGRGDIVGTSQVSVAGLRTATVATLWRGETLWNLNDLVDDRDGCTLEEATAITESGRILVQALCAGVFRIAILEPNGR